MHSAILSGKHVMILVFVHVLFYTSFASCQVFPLQKAFAHNDYWHKRPLYDALENGYTNIEADIYARNGRLIVAHALPRLRNKRTLENLYLQPLYTLMQTDSTKTVPNHHDPLMLMIDIKSDADKTYKLLSVLLEKYQSILSGYENGKLVVRQVTIVLSGHKPIELIRQEKNRHAFIDEDLRKVNNDTASNIYPMASCKYSSLIKWKGKGVIPGTDKKRLCAYINRAHEYGKKVRLWASPENKTVWKELLACGVDLICTDNLSALKNFLLSSTFLFTKQ